MKSIYAQAQQLNWVLIAIMLIGLGLRWWGISWGLPYTYHSDERVGIVIHILQTGNLNPEFFDWGSLLLYLNAILYLGYFAIGLVVGRFTSLSDLPYPDRVTMAVGKTTLPEEFLLGRGLTGVFGVLSIVIVYLICLQIQRGRVAAWLAALLLAVESVDVRNSQFIRPDVLAIFFALCSLLFALKIVDDPQVRNYVLAGLCAGLAASSKYNAGLIVVAIVAAHLIQFGYRGLRRKEIYLAALSSAIAFGLTTPFAILAPAQFLQLGPFHVQGYLSTVGKLTTESSLYWYGSFLWTNLGIILLLALCQFAATAFARDKKGIVLASFPAAYFAFICTYSYHIETMVLPIIPMLLVAAALFVARVHNFWLSHWSPSRVPVGATLIALTVFLALPQFIRTAQTNAQLLEPDAREYARRWIETNLLPGTRIALEPYSPYLDRQKFIVNGFDWLLDHKPDWYVAQGYEYLVFSSGNPGVGTDQYNSFFTRFPVVAKFDENGIEIIIAKIDVVLPSHRVAARFGNEGELIELVGYDDATQKWMPGQPLQVKLTWRTIEQKIEPFEVGLRLLDKNDREVGNMRGDLFQGKGWREGIFSTDWTIPVQGTAAPGVYHLKVNIIESRYAYQTPAQTWAGDPLDRVVLGPIKMSVLLPTAIELQDMQQARVQFGNSITLLGYLTTTNARAGDSLPLTLYWQPLAQPSRDYTVFVHLVDANRKVVAQVDTQPRGGAYSSSLWDASEIIQDDYALQLPTGLAPGLYRIEIGLYEYPSLARLAITNMQGNSSGDHWVLPDAVQIIQ
jgi:Dolichyl-phosphate-mannose-protein mannosyltransferase